MLIPQATTSSTVPQTAPNWIVLIGTDLARRRDQSGRSPAGVGGIGACVLVLALAASGWLSRPAYASSAAGESRVETIFMTSRRPLWSFVDQFRARYGINVTYEEAEAPLADCGAPDEETDDAAASLDSRAVIALWYSVSFQVLPATGQPVDAAGALRAALATYEAACGGATARYGLRVDGAVFHIVPVEVRGFDGSWVKTTPVLDTPIVLARTTLPVWQAVYLVLGTTSRATGKAMMWGDAAMGWTFTSTVELGGPRPQAARTMLSRALAPSTWDFVYGPLLATYVLRVAPLERPAADHRSP